MKPTAEERIHELNKALLFIKENHNGEIPYQFSSNEYGLWMARYANNALEEYKESFNINKRAEIKQDEELGLYEGDSKSTKELIKEIWELWESMAECGELHIGPQFSANYKRLKAQIRQLSDIITERTHLLVRANEQISELDLANKMYKQDLEEAEKRIKELEKK